MSASDIFIGTIIACAAVLVSVVAFAMTCRLLGEFLLWVADRLEQRAVRKGIENFGKRKDV